jgi:hypothetical protein
MVRAETRRVGVAAVQAIGLRNKKVGFSRYLIF